MIEERTVKVNAAQWIGRRVRQEDAYAVRHFPQGTLVVVCDGMGGHACGCKAAEIASKSFADRFDGAKGDSVSERMRDALNRANQSVGEFFAKERAYGGCTLLAVYLSSGVLWWTSVGDSPLLVWRRGRLMRLNADHSLRRIGHRNISGAFLALGCDRGEDSSGRCAADALSFVAGRPDHHGQ